LEKYSNNWSKSIRAYIDSLDPLFAKVRRTAFDNFSFKEPQEKISSSVLTVYFFVRLLSPFIIMPLLLFWIAYV